MPSTTHHPYRDPSLADIVLALLIFPMWWVWRALLARSWLRVQGPRWYAVQTPTAGWRFDGLLPGPGRHPFTESDGPGGREDGKGDVD